MFTSYVCTISSYRRKCINIIYHYENKRVYTDRALNTAYKGETFQKKVYTYTYMHVAIDVRVWHLL